MSFVRQVDPSTTCTDNIYIHKFGAPNSNFAARRSASDTQLFRYGPEPYNSEDYGHMGFTDAPSAAIQNSFYNQQASLTPYHVTADGRSPAVVDDLSNSSSDEAKQSPVVSNVSQQNAQSISDNQSSELEVEFDEDEIRLKLQELDHALLDDDDDILFEISKAGSISDEWANPMKNVLLPNSSKESESSISCAGSNNEEARTPKRLEKLAEDCGVSFEFRAVGANIEDVTPAMLDCCSGEALVVNFAFQLHHLPDESVSIMNERDQLLRMVKGLQRKLVTLVEQDGITNTAPFLTRFREVYDYYSALFESLDATLPRESPDRMNVER